MDVEIMIIKFSNYQCSVHVSYLHFGRILESRFVILSVLSLKAVWCPPIPSRLPVKTVDISNPLVGDIQCLLGNKHRNSNLRVDPAPDMWQEIYFQCFFRWVLAWISCTYDGNGFQTHYLSTLQYKTGLQTCLLTSFWICKPTTRLWRMLKHF